MVFQDLSYNEACLKANLPKLSERRDTLSQNLFANIVRNKDHKLAHICCQKMQYTRVILGQLEHFKTQYAGQTVSKTLTNYLGNFTKKKKSNGI